MSEADARLVRLLADGRLHSGARLAASLGVTRAAVWKTVAELRERGVEVLSEPRRGYRLARPVELIGLAALHAGARAAGASLPDATEVLFEVGSTNEYLYAAEPPAPGRPRLVFAERQTAGRGRRGRTWLAPFGSGLTFSIGWSFDELPADLPALGLAMGVCVVRALRALGAAEVGLKWPNDVVWRGRKLGGLLLQMRSESGGPAHVVVGLGLNLELPESLRERLAEPPATPATDLTAALGSRLPSRNAIAGAVAGAMLAGLGEFSRRGYAPFSAEWAAADSLRDAAVTVLRVDGALHGVARGADADGSLRVEIEGGALERVHAGDVSLRAAHAGAERSA
jgi:BirA family biotin operon repressor/biotin-[acetyl-CoA-carboxylase] ligase